MFGFVSVLCRFTILGWSLNGIAVRDTSRILYSFIVMLNLDLSAEICVIIPHHDPLPTTFLDPPCSWLRPPTIWLRLTAGWLQALSFMCLNGPQIYVYVRLSPTEKWYCSDEQTNIILFQALRTVAGPTAEAAMQRLAFCIREI